MEIMQIGKAFEINPKVNIKRGTEVPFVSMDQLVAGQRDVHATEHRLFSSGSKFESGDTLMARITPCLENKKIARYSPNEQEEKIAAGSTEFIVLRGKEGVTTDDFAYYFATSPYIHELAISLMSGTSGRQRVETSAFKDFPVPIPSITVQENLCAVLGSLDDKISANHRIIQLSDELIHSCYSSVKRVSESSTFADVANIYGGSTPSTQCSNYWEGPINWATPTDITSLNGPWLLDTDRSVSEAGLQSMSSQLNPPHSILMTSRATIGEVALASIPTATNQGFIVVVAPDVYVPWLYAQLKSRTAEFKAWANGATFLEISRGNFKKLPFHACSDADLRRFNEVAWPLLHRSLAAQNENKNLETTRDEILPLLISSKITLADAEDHLRTIKKEVTDV